MFLRGGTGFAGSNLELDGCTVNSIKRYMQSYFVEAMLMYLLFV